MNSPKVLLISDTKDLVEDLEKVLKDNYCLVDTQLIGEKKQVRELQERKGERYDYMIFISLRRNGDNSTAESCFNDSLVIARNSKAKTVFILPYYVIGNRKENNRDKSRKILEDEEIFSAVIYSGEIHKEWKLLDVDGPFGRLANDINSGEQVVEFSKDEEYRMPIESEHFAKTVVKKLFSISSFGKDEAMISYLIPAIKIKERVDKLYGGGKVELTPNTENYSKMEGEVLVENDTQEGGRMVNGMVDNLIASNKTSNSKTPRESHESKKNMFTGSLLSLTQKPQISRNMKEHEDIINTTGVIDKKKGIKLWRRNVNTENVKERKESRKISINKKSVGKYFLKFSALLVILLIMPIVLLFFSLGLFKSSLYVAGEGYLKNAEKSIALAEKLSSASKKYAGVFNKAPIIGYTHSTIYEVAEYFTREIGIARKAISIKSDLIEGIDEFVSKEPFSIEELSDNISLEIDYLTQEIDFLRSDTKELSKISDYIARKLLGNQAFLVKGNLNHYKDIMDSLPFVLGHGGRTKYLVVMQNDSISRASGGLIESVLLITFEKGKFINMEAISSKELDSNLVGDVEPPSPLKEHFNENKWYFRDSNWFSDFRNTSEQIEWFIDKELDEQVDGVVAVNYRFLKRVIELYGQLEIEGVATVNIENISSILEASSYETYPENYDADLLAAELLKGIIEEFPNLKSKDQSIVLDEFLSGLTDKDIQIFVHNNKFRRSILDIGWGGSTYVEDCIGNCYEDYVGIIETEHTDSRFIITNKLATLDIWIEEGLIKRKLTFFIENIGSDQERNAGVYKSYVRLLIPSNSGVGLVKIITEDSESEVKPQIVGIEGNKEVGAFVEVNGGNTAAIVFSWESGVDLDMGINGEYGLNWIRQPGTKDYPAEVGLFVNAEGMNFDLINLNLTDENRFGYNTSLSRDIISRIFWQK